MTSMDGGTGHWRIELEESYPVMGLTSLEVELEPSYEGLEFRSRGRLLTTVLGDVFSTKINVYKRLSELSFLFPGGSRRAPILGKQ